MDVLFPPGPQKSLLLGDAPQFKDNPLDYLLQSARAYGDIVHFRFGPSHAYLLTNPRDAHDVLVERFDQFESKPSLMLALNSAMGHDLFAPKDPPKKRSLRRGVFKSAWLEPFIGDAVQTSTQALETWQGGDPVALLEMLTLRIVTRTLFGNVTVQIEELSRRLARALSAQQDEAHFQSPLTLPLWIPTPQNRKRQRAQSELRQIVRQLVNQRPDGVFGHLLAAPIGEDWAIEEMLALFQSGYNAAASTLAWAWSLLAQHPETADILHEEVACVLGDRQPTMADVPHLTYCEMVFKETLRLHPPVWLISRQAKKETRLGEYFVPTGSTIFVSPYIIQHSPRYFTSPDLFLPERFGESLARRTSAFAYMPFGAGTHAEGEHDYATVIGKLVLALGAQRFRLSESNPASPEISLQPRGLKLQPERSAV
ncbi:MAG: cytochrome P450 [Chloroflexi bacterium]|nr:cytochrome P450 [Chloroflexota bacterium]